MTTSTPQPRNLWLAFGLVAVLGLSAGNQLNAQADGMPNLAGTWTWTWKDGTGNTHRHVLEVEGTGTKLAAREIFDDQEPVRVGKLVLDGKSVKFTVMRGQNKSDYNGKVADADHINGTVVVTTNGEATEFPWKAERRKDIPK